MDYAELESDFNKYKERHPSPSPLTLEEQFRLPSEFGNPADDPLPGSPVDVGVQTTLTADRTVEDIERLLEHLPHGFADYPWHAADWDDIEALVYEPPAGLFQDFNGPILEPRLQQPSSENSSEYRTAPSSPTFEATLAYNTEWLFTFLPTSGV